MGNPVQTEPKKPNTGMIIGIVAIVVVVLMCACAVVVIAALTIMGPLVGQTFSTINRDIALTAMPDFPTMPSDFPTMPSEFPTISPDGLSNPIPEGGRGDDLQRASAWSYVIVAAAFDSCVLSSPKASDITIAVTEEPNSDGVWVEEWVVSCDSGSKKTYSVTFTPGSNGDTDIKVK